MLERLKLWSAWLEVTGRRPKTIRQYRYWLIRFAADTLIDPWDVTEDELVAYLASMPKTGPGRRSFLAAARSYWKWAGPKAERDPTARLHVSRPSEPKAPTIAPEVFRDILREAFRREQRRGWTLLLMWASGLRIGSLVAIQPEDVNLAEGRLWIRESKGGRTYEIAMSRLDSAAASWLVRDAHEAGRERLVGVGEEQIRKWLREAALTAGISDRVWPHLLRHSFATALARVTDPKTWMVGMGHVDLSNYPRYVHTDEERVRDAKAKIRL